MADFEYLGTSVRQIDVEDRRLARGRIRDLEAQRAEFADVTLESVLFERCSLLSAQWTRCNLSRVVFRDCRLVGATFDEHKWANVIFQGCVVEYVTLDTIRAIGPIAFVETKLRDVTFTGCDLGRGHMSGCELQDVEFVGGNYSDFDLRGNDLSTVRGADNLRGVIVSRSQRQELAEALVSQLELTYMDDLT